MKKSGQQTTGSIILKVCACFLKVLFLKAHGFEMNKGDFCDGVTSRNSSTMEANAVTCDYGAIINSSGEYQSIQPDTLLDFTSNLYCGCCAPIDALE